MSQSRVLRQVLFAINPSYYNMQQLRNSRHRWLWIVFGLWLTLFQTSVAAHAVEEGIVPHEHSHCLLCHGGHIVGAAPTPLPSLAVVEQHPITIVAPVPQAPTLLIVRQQLARGPPVLR
ncbi:hypothetical protein L9G74_04540 [Shewanella sp. C32]|uniref:DUF2946 domain-containing protein n=1 Tax=Shewanella electrica TaxID=515560 RepID=A0ABT2FI84_9GAMM|nr:hypothetical protein [Shewanella electrica]MCH1923600.1 hypothetical protein [Shewanella electrica]MCS4555696.1 hypothetical protein [Shewanella electrica]